MNRVPATAVIATALCGLLVLTACSTPVDAPDARPTPTASATPAPAPTAVVEVPVTSAAIDDADFGAPTPPVRVQIPSADISVPVRAVGVRGDGLMDIPDNVNVAGWYRYGADPASEEGRTVIAAHVDSLEYGLGPFVGLRSLKKGAKITVTTRDGESHRYAVSSVTYTRKAALPVKKLFSRVGEPRLVLITCGGQFDTKTRTYSDNVVLIATPQRG